jgi:hypothetical protein
MKGYQFDPDKIYHSYNVSNSMDMVRRRKLSWAEIGFAIYIRAKSKRFGNPFYLTDDSITQETGLSAKTFRKLRERLQVKGVISYDSFHGRGKSTIYTCVDNFMISTEKPTHSGIKPTHLGNKTYPNGRFSNDHKNKNKKEDKNNDYSIRENRSLEPYLQTRR